MKLAKRNKVFEETAFIGLAIDGTGAGRTTKEACPLCHPVQDAQGKVTCQIHHFVMISVVGAGITLPFDVEPYRPGDSEYARGQALAETGGEPSRTTLRRLCGGRREVRHRALSPHRRCGGSARPGAPERRTCRNSPRRSKPASPNQPPTVRFQHGEDRIEVWDADDFDPWETLDWPTVRVMRYRQHKTDGTVVQADWLTDFSIARLGTRSFFKLAKSRWEIENQGFNDGKNLYGMEHIQHHHPNSMLVNWLFLLLALIIERLYRIRYLHRGTHPRPHFHATQGHALAQSPARRTRTPVDGAPRRLPPHRSLTNHRPTPIRPEEDRGIAVSTLENGRHAAPHAGLLHTTRQYFSANFRNR